MITRTGDDGLRRFVQDTRTPSFISLYSKHWMHFCAVAARITGDREAAEDIVQEVFVSLLEKRAEKKIENIDGYLYQALRFRCFRWLRDAKTSADMLRRMELALFENTTENDVNLSFAVDSIKQVVSRMPSRYREVFELSRFQHLSNDQIAARLAINRRTVENHLCKALRILRVAVKSTTSFLLTFLSTQ